MRILMVNKFLYTVGGAENYMFSLASKLKSEGHEVQFFGLSNQKNVAGNDFNIYVKSYDDKKIFNPFSLVYSRNAKKKMTKILKLYKPDIVHMNNISFHLTSSIVDACKKLNIPVIMTVHDPQITCPNHMFYRYSDNKICTECLDGNFKHCLDHKCLKNSFLKSYLGYREAIRTHKKKPYDYISYFVVPSNFLISKLVEGGYSKDKCVYLCNPISDGFGTNKKPDKEDYILYYGRISQEKGIKTLIKSIPDGIKLKVAGTGDLVDLLKENKNIEYLGFKNGQELKDLISHARFSIYPSVWYENCPLSIIESISLGTPVIGSNRGGNPELIKDGETGLLFIPDDENDLRNKIIELYNDKNYQQYVDNCLKYKQMTMDDYYSLIMNVYQQSIDNNRR